VKQFGLNKSDKLCSPTAIDMLFSRGADFNIYSSIAYPLRAVWRENEKRTTGNYINFLISIPKKRIRNAVDRVKMRRRVREAYRLNYKNFDYKKNIYIDLAFIYISNDLTDYQIIEKSVCKILQKISDCEKNYTQ